MLRNSQNLSENNYTVTKAYQRVEIRRGAVKCLQPNFVNCSKQSVIIQRFLSYFSLLNILIIPACALSNPAPAPQDSTNTSNISSPPTSTFIESVPRQYLAYSETTYNTLLGKKPLALFFHAAWCPVCVEMEKNIQADFESFPEGTVILKVNYDTATALKQKYEILTQSTIVVIDNQGAVTSKLNAPDNQALKNALKEVL